MTICKGAYPAPNVAALTAGSGELGALVIDLVKKKLAAGKIDGVTAVLETLRQTARENYQQWLVPSPQCSHHP